MPQQQQPQQSASRLDEAGELRAQMDDWRWALEQMTSGSLDQYAGKYVAVLNQRCVGSADDPDALRRETARRAQVAADRVVVVFVESSADPIVFLGASWRA